MDELRSKSQFCYDILFDLLEEPLNDQDIKLTDTNYGFHMTISSSEKVSRYMLYLAEYDVYVLRIEYVKNEKENYTVVYDKNYNICYEGKLFDIKRSSRIYLPTGEYLEFSSHYPESLIYLPNKGLIRAKFNSNDFNVSEDALIYLFKQKVIKSFIIDYGQINRIRDKIDI